jgi:hypothetical protein
LALRLPGDLQKLFKLADLTLDQLCEALADDGWYDGVRTRQQLAADVEAVKAGRRPSDATDANKTSDGDQGSKQLGGTQQRVARQKNGSSDEGEALDGSAVEDREVDAADEDQEADAADQSCAADTMADNLNEKGAVDQTQTVFAAASPEAVAVDRTARELRDFVIESLSDRLEAPKFEAFVKNGVTREALHRAIVHRVAELLVS